MGMFVYTCMQALTKLFVYWAGVVGRGNKESCYLKDNPPWRNYFPTFIVPYSTAKHIHGCTTKICMKHQEKERIDKSMNKADVKRNLEKMKNIDSFYTQEGKVTKGYKKLQKVTKGFQTKLTSWAIEFLACFQSLV